MSDVVLDVNDFGYSDVAEPTVNPKENKKSEVIFHKALTYVRFRAYSRYRCMLLIRRQPLVRSVFPRFRDLGLLPRK